MTTNLAVIRRYIDTILNLKIDQESEKITFDEIKSGVIFKGTNFWIMTFAIIISCIGLNINSKAAVIGAMIISPIMGPIFGIGFSLATANVSLLQLSIKNVFRIIVICILSSTFYYLLSPYHIATDELLSFSKPTIFDILLAFIGGMAGMIAISRHDGSRVLVGIAVATACIPPLCTAGFGIATLQWQYILGGLYTYFINALFICLGSYVITRYLKFEHYSTKDIKNVTSYFSVLGLLTAIPAIYLAYNLWTENNYRSKVNYFITNVLNTKYHVLNSSLDKESNTIKIDVLVDKYDDNLNRNINSELMKYELQNSKIQLYQTLKATNSQSEIDLLRQELNELKQKLNKNNQILPNQ